MVQLFLSLVDVSCSLPSAPMLGSFLGLGLLLRRVFVDYLGEGYDAVAFVDLHDLDALCRPAESADLVWRGS